MQKSGLNKVIIQLGEVTKNNPRVIFSTCVDFCQSQLPKLVKCGTE